MPLAAALPAGWWYGIGSGAAAGGEGEEGVDRGLERTDVLPDLGQQEAALKRGEQSSGRFVVSGRAGLAPRVRREGVDVVEKVSPLALDLG
jgi:hypothetical protein